MLKSEELAKLFSIVELCDYVLKGLCPSLSVVQSQTAVRPSRPAAAYAVPAAATSTPWRPSPKRHRREKESRPPQECRVYMVGTTLGMGASWQSEAVVPSMALAGIAGLALVLPI
jgi:hypothetical protein